MKLSQKALGWLGGGVTGLLNGLFGSGGGALLAKKANAPLLAQIPMDPAFLRRCDDGELPAGLENSPAVRAELDKVVKAITAAK